MISSSVECAAILRSAKAALATHGNFFLGNLKIESELVDLDLLTSSERFMTVDLLLDEISFAQYQGPAPPNDVCAHLPYKGAPLHAFCWKSSSLGKRIYLKFSVVSTNAGDRLVLYSLHPPRN